MLFISTLNELKYLLKVVVLYIIALVSFFYVNCIKCVFLLHYNIKMLYFETNAILYGSFLNYDFFIRRDKK